MDSLASCNGGKGRGGEERGGEGSLITLKVKIEYIWNSGLFQGEKDDIDTAGKGGGNILCYFKAQKFTIAWNLHLLFLPCKNINLRFIKVVLCIRSKRGV